MHHLFKRARVAKKEAAEGGKKRSRPKAASRVSQGPREGGLMALREEELIVRNRGTGVCRPVLAFAVGRHATGISPTGKSRLELFWRPNAKIHFSCRSLPSKTPSLPTATCRFSIAHRSRS